MVDRIGIFQIDVSQGSIKAVFDDGEEQLVSRELYGDNASTICRLFIKGYEQGVRDTQKQIKGILGL